ncbi:complement C1q tumor necrosis factor-related protein 4-like [Asterias amurensis]|uniref:complement C1q tumor necrosis factor-related protein 4-like n=1 Tax=Asterias amurensis TaxID=7602 RepID=UPI003AB258CF
MTDQKSGGGAMMNLLVVTILYMLYASHPCRCMSTFHKDAAFTYVNVANNPTSYPLDPADADVQPLLDRNGQTALFTAPIPGTYVFTFTAGKNVRGKSKVTHYKLIKEGVAVEVLFRLTVNGPAFAHTVVDLDQGDKVYVSTYAQPPAVPVVPDASLESPVIFSGFNLYHRCLCSPLIVRQSAFSAQRPTEVPSGSGKDIAFPTTVLDLNGDFDGTTGIFKAKIPGIYVFMYSFPNTRTNVITVNLLVNAAIKATVSSKNSADLTVQYAGTTVVVDLNEDDEVKLVKNGQRISFPGNVDDGGVSYTPSPILFSGFLL